ncbi:MAG TPA: response regulator [Blastocatellia bacterium]|jgi:CheY-like chemotaxis protein|nr:response regulator [Blastocatellia bacterium]
MCEKILVVEDHADTREILSTLLQFEGWNVIKAEDGLEGLEMAESQHPDLILTDINMPRLNGINFITRLRTNPDFADVPIVALTAYGQIMKDEAIDAGANRVMDKPIEFDAFINVVKEICNPH